MSSAFNGEGALLVDAAVECSAAALGVFWCQYFLLVHRYFILSMMKTLDSFASPNNPHSIFQDADPEPVFFENNLVDPARVVKHFSSDPQANIRVFYYQYLKLCFELENVDFEGYIRKIEELINNDEFKFMFYEEDDPQVYNDLQFKQLIMEFFGLLGEGGIGIQDAINYYPIMDTVFIYFFRALLILTGRTDALDSYIEREELFQFLCSYFNVEITIHDKCIKFVDSDIFVYEEDPKDVYMAYMEDAEQESSRDNVDQHQPQQHYEQYQQQEYQYPPQSDFQNYSHEEDHEETHQEEQAYPPQADAANQPVQIDTAKYEQATPIHDISYGSSSSQRGTSEINKSYISSEFVDYTQTNSNLTSMVKKDLKESAEISKQPTFGKIAIDTHEASKQAKTNNQFKLSSEPAYESPLNINNYFPEPSKYSPFNNQYSNTNNENANASTQLPISNKPNEYSSKPASHHQETPFTKKEETSYVSKPWQAPLPPTKDPGFAKSAAQDSQFQPYVSNASSNKYTQLLNDKYEAKKPTYTAYEQKTEKKPGSSFDPNKYAANTYTPPSYISNITSNATTKTASNIGLPQNNIPNPSSNYKPPSPSPAQPPMLQQYQPYTSSTSSSGKNPFNLNVSLQFTNSFTMKVMAEPYRTNVKTIRNRARDFRNSLKNYIK